MNKIKPGSFLKNDRYYVEKLLRDGSHAKIWLATMETGSGESQEVVIKEFKYTDGEYEYLKPRVELEANILNLFKDHACMVTFFDLEVDDNLYLVMDYIKGQNLAERMDALRGPFDFEDALAFAEQLASILNRIHSHSSLVVHRDLKPSNVLITEANRIYLIDFTYALASERTIREFGVVDEELDGIGTPDYRAPEQALHSRVTPSADIYSFGLIVGEMLSRAGLKRRIEQNKNALHEDISEDIPSYVVDAIEKALQEDPRDRHESALAFIEALKKPPTRIPSLGRSRKSSKQQVLDAENMILIEPGNYKTGLSEEILEQWQKHKFYVGNLKKMKKKTFSGFYIDPTPVTNRQYKQFLDDTKYRPPERRGNDVRVQPYMWQENCPPAGLDDHPVVLVSYKDAEAYAEWAGKRLPTGLEWERAARGPEGLLYPWGNEWDLNHCNTLEWWAQQPIESYSRLSVFQKRVNRFIKEILAKNNRPQNDPRPVMTTPVTHFPPNEAGVFDMAGNIWEWTSDIAHRKWGVQYMYLRGGAWFFGRVEACPAVSVFLPKGERLPYVGFRCVADENKVK